MIAVIVYVKSFLNAKSHGLWSFPPCSLHISLSAQGQTMLSALVFSTLLWLSLILALRFCLKLLLSYHQWMFEQHGRISNTTKVWVVRPLPTGVTAPSGGCAAEVPFGDFWIIIIIIIIILI